MTFLRWGFLIFLNLNELLVVSPQWNLEITKNAQKCTKEHFPKNRDCSVQMPNMIIVCMAKKFGFLF
jgi:hypothetical protein